MNHALAFHPLANLFPMLPDAELSALAEDIKASGQQNPIITYFGQILDGRNRYRACELAGIEPVIEKFVGDDPLAYVISQNLHRRHLSESQRADVAGKLANMPHGGDRRSDQAAKLPLENVTQEAAAKMLNVSVRLLRDAQEIRRKAPEQAAAIERGEKTVTEVKRQLVKEEIVKRVVEKPSGKYRIFYADPPWRYGDTRNGLEGTTGAESHYPTMSIAELCALPIADMADENAVLFLWVTSPLLFECAPMIRAWGFSYKTSFVWDKVKHNMGHYNSVRHEFLLVCTRGSCTPDNVKLFDSVQSVERTEKHSEKPQEFRQIIDTLYPNGKRIELFARAKHETWDVWGNQA